jgi:hypothetical protein
LQNANHISISIAARALDDTPDSGERLKVLASCYGNLEVVIAAQARMSRNALLAIPFRCLVKFPLRPGLPYFGNTFFVGHD